MIRGQDGIFLHKFMTPSAKRSKRMLIRSCPICFIVIACAGWLLLISRWPERLRVGTGQRSTSGGANAFTAMKDSCQSVGMPSLRCLVSEHVTCCACRCRTGALNTVQPVAVRSEKLCLHGPHLIPFWHYQWPHAGLCLSRCQVCQEACRAPASDPARMAACMHAGLQCWPHCCRRAVLQWLPCRGKSFRHQCSANGHPVSEACLTQQRKLTCDRHMGACSLPGPRSTCPPHSENRCESHRLLYRTSCAHVNATVPGCSTHIRHIPLSHAHGAFFCITRLNGGQSVQRAS